jgi:hypothetical protein
VKGCPHGVDEASIGRPIIAAEKGAARDGHFLIRKDFLLVKNGSINGLKVGI